MIRTKKKRNNYIPYFFCFSLIARFMLINSRPTSVFLFKWSIISLTLNSSEQTKRHFSSLFIILPNSIIISSLMFSSINHFCKRRYINIIEVLSFWQALYTLLTFDNNLIQFLFYS